jgi:hypothetical protein
MKQAHIVGTLESQMKKGQVLVFGFDEFETQFRQCPVTHKTIVKFIQKDEQQHTRYLPMSFNKVIGVVNHEGVPSLCMTPQFRNWVNTLELEVTA